MRDRDLAESSLASCQAPDMGAEIDSPQDLIAELLSSVPMPRTFEERTEQFFRVLEAYNDEESGVLGARSSESRKEDGRPVVVMKVTALLFGDSKLSAEIPSLFCQVYQSLLAQRCAITADEVIRTFSEDLNFSGDVRMVAHAAWVGLSKSGESYQAIGNSHGVTRACVQHHARRFEEKTGIRPRRAKSDTARAISTERARERGSGRVTRRRSWNCASAFPGLAFA